MTRVTPKTLLNWRTRGILIPSVVTTSAVAPLLYSFRDLVAIRVLAALRDSGIDPAGLKRVVEYLRQRKGLSATDVLASTVLLTNGRDVYEVDGAISVSALQKPGQVVLHLVSLGPLVTEIQRDARAALRAA